MELDKVLEFAVTLAWQNLLAGDELLSARVEYQSERGMRVDFLTVWTLRSWGYQDRVCDYWASASPAHPAGACFTKSYHSNALAQALDFIMQNQDQFTHPDAGRPHMVLIQPPTPELAAEAAAWMAGNEAAASNRASGARATPRRRSPRPGFNGAASRPRLPGNGSGGVVDNQSGFPNGPWCR